MNVSIFVAFVFGSFSLEDERGWRGDAHFTDEDCEAARGAGVQMGSFTGPDRIFLFLVCLSLAGHTLP